MKITIKIEGKMDGKVQVVERTATVPQNELRYFIDGHAFKHTLDTTAGRKKQASDVEIMEHHIQHVFGEMTQALNIHRRRKSIEAHLATMSDAKLEEANG